MKGSDKKDLETMEGFFDARSIGYDQHMLESVADFAGFYEAVGRQIPRTASRIDILDLGCGTGLEFEPIFRRAPQVRVTGIDLSASMLARLREKYSERLDQLTLFQASYLDFDLGQGGFDYCISVMTLHHLPPAVKVDMYSRILDALKPGGLYIEGDYVVSPAKEVLALAAYNDLIGTDFPEAGGLYHLDLPLSKGHQLGLLQEAGFSSVKITWEGEEAAVLAASK
jgi:tRNA (cmo5U34)-methyltransferase